MTMKMRIRSAAIAIAVAAVSCAHAQNLISNGGFEKPAVPVGGFTTFATGTGFPGWKVVGARGNVGVTSTQFVARGFNLPAHAGSQWIDLSGTIDLVNVGVQQAVATTPGVRYQLKFSIGNVFDDSGPFGTSSRVDVFLNGMLATSAITFLGDPTNMAWEDFSFEFVATSNKTTLTFMDADPQGDQICGLDSVSLTVAGDSNASAGDAAAQ